MVSTATAEEASYPQDFSDADVTTDPLQECFAAGTMIATPEGERAVETLAPGDLVVTAEGRAVPVLWVGRQTLHKIFTPADRFSPVRVSEGALGEGLPTRDLVLTGDHALLIDGMAINAGALVNGTTIARVPASELPQSVTYYHVETEAHDMILANGSAAETFVDYLGRRPFDNYDEYVARHGTDRDIPEMTRIRISSQRQVPAEIRARLGLPAVAA
ncbi:Hint domain-containing protein [Mangrovicoccus sp. HB182678]|uniref:Hint domain-containing protein n=2 Tax=Mangrovicoccus algicola TaxID=2771008 RepID=A0A8J6Z4N6_9RHOB|nr:Hint domain-containing protein [Mangrovicoccus algicola]